MKKRLTFAGTGGSLLVKFIVGVLLTGITFGIYLPWFMVDLWKFIAENTTLHGTERGSVRFRFAGTGGGLLVTWIVGLLLSFITLGIYLPWFMVDLTRFLCDNAEARTDDGSRLRLSFDGTGGSLFVTFIVGYILTFITFGIYMPWFLCDIQRFYAKHTAILEIGTASGEKQVGRFDFHGTGGELFVTFLVGMLLTIVTFGIYQFWFQVKLFKFFAGATRVTVFGAAHRGAFSGTGGELLLKSLIGALLTSITFGIYGAWFFVDLTKWQIEGLSFGPTGEVAP